MQNWFAGRTTCGKAQLAEIDDGSGHQIETCLNLLIATMAVFEVNKQGFNPSNALIMPADTTLQSAITAS